MNATPSNSRFMAAVRDSASAEVPSRTVGDWSDEVWRVYGALEVMVPNDGRFGGSLTQRRFDHLQTVDMRSSPFAVRRTDSMIRTHPVESIVATMLVAGEGLVVQDGRSCALQAGDLTFLDSRRPYSMVLDSTPRVLDFVWPREHFGLSDTECEAVTARPLLAASPIGRWLAPALVGLHEIDQGLSEAGAIRIADGVRGLLVTAALELATPEEGNGRWRQQYDDIVKFIARNLDSDELSVDQIAETFFMSKRSVHRLFARFGNTVTAVIRDIRLEEARQRMVSNAYRHQSVSFIASQLGFSSLQVFSRAFTAKYGIGPKQYRAAQG